MFDFISDEFFHSLESMWMLLGIVAVAIAFLGKGADWLVDSASEIATDLGVGKLIVGATIVSLGTTAPEASVSVYAAWMGNANLALGNAIGSIICDTGLIFGIACLMSTIPINKKLVNRQGWLQFGVGVLLAALCFLALFMNGSAEGAVLGRWVGVLLTGLLVGYLYLSFRWVKDEHAHSPGAKEDFRDVNTKRLLRHFVFLGIGLSFVLLSSRVLIGSVSELALRWHVPDDIIAATVVAFGTSLPELVTAVTGVLKGQKELVLGNIIGADILNVLFVVGASGLVTALPIEKSFFIIHLPVMLGILALFRVFIYVSKDSFKRWMGIPFLAIYIVYVISQYA